MEFAEPRALLVGVDVGKYRDGIDNVETAPIEVCRGELAIKLEIGPLEIATAPLNGFRVDIRSIPADRREASQQPAQGAATSASEVQHAQGSFKAEPKAAQTGG